MRLSLDTARVQGYNEVDAVGLVTGEGVVWAAAAESSSWFGMPAAR